MKGKVKPLIAFLTTSKPQQQLSLSISIRRDNRIMCEHYKTLSLVLSRRKFHKIVYGHFFHMSQTHGNIPQRGWRQTTFKYYDSYLYAL